VSSLHVDTSRILTGLLFCCSLLLYLCMASLLPAEAPCTSACPFPLYLARLHFPGRLLSHAFIPLCCCLEVFMWRITACYHYGVLLPLYTCNCFFFFFFAWGLPFTPVKEALEPGQRRRKGDDMLGGRHAFAYLTA